MQTMDDISGLLAAAPQPVAQPSERCPNCDDTGDVHSIDGQWRGSCHCPAGTVAQAKPEQAQPAVSEKVAFCHEKNAAPMTLRDAQPERVTKEMWRAVAESQAEPQ